ncbi:MAG: HAMP domain-containing protein [Emcibacteraceae bacterium]|nr:HAMP domain-containing protein [Emcibacteraceae bacterium]
MYLVSFFNNFNVSRKIWMLAGIAITGFIAIFITSFVTGSMEDAAQAEADAGNALEQAEARMEASSLVVRRREKDFFLRLDPKYITTYNEDMDITIEWLEKSGAATDSSQVDIAVSDLENILERHRVQFNKVSDMWITAGLTTEDGYYAEMQDTVHYIEEALAEQGNDALTVKMLMMRRHEKDLMLRVAVTDGNGEYSNGPKYAGRILERQIEFNEILDASRMSNDVKADIKSKVDSYVLAFNRYARIRMDLVTETQILSDIYSETGGPFKELKATADEIYEHGIEAVQSANSTAQISLIIIIIVFGGISAITAIFAIKTIVRPVKDLENALTHIAEGDYETEVPGTSSKDELGSMAKVIVVLRDSAKERIELERKAGEVEKERLQIREDRMLKDQAAAKEKAEAEADDLARREARTKDLEDLVQNFDENIKTVLSSLQASSSQMRSTAGGMVEVADSTGQQAAMVSEEAEKMQENVSTMASAIE